MTGEDLQQLKEAFALYHAANWHGVVDICQTLVARSPQMAPAWHLWGLAELRIGNAAVAVTKISQAISLDVLPAHYFNHLGAAFESLGRPIEALANFERAAALNPHYIEAHANCAALLERDSRWEEAEVAIARACAIEPRREDLLFRRCYLLVTLGRRAEAVTLLRDAIVHRPSAALYSRLGKVLLEGDNLVSALAALQSSLAITTENADVWFDLGRTHEHLGDAQQASEAMEKAVSLTPHDAGRRVRAYLVSPSVFDSAEEITRFQNDLHDQLIAVNAPAVGMSQWLEAGVYPPFAMNFQGRQTRPVKERLASIVRGDRQLKPARLRTGKPRLGFVVTVGHEGLFIRCTGGIVDRLNRQEFDVYVIGCPSTLQYLSQQLKSNVTFVPLPVRYDQAVETLDRVACDLLYHWEIGSDALNYLLPFANSAPVQCTSWGTQVTSGVREVDYYLSSRWIERDDGDSHYTETLVRLESLPTWQRRIPPAPATDKDYFGWSPWHHIYLCPQNLLKIHPDQDALFARILDADPSALLVLKQTKSPEVARRLLQRLRRSLGENASRVVMLPWLSRGDYYRLVSVADVVLDPLHYSAGSSCYDMLSCAQPIVTLPGELNVGRFTQACYRVIDYPPLIASDEDDYVRLAVSIGSDVDFRDEVRKQLRDRVPQLFEDARTVIAHEGFFRQAIAESRR